MTDDRNNVLLSELNFEEVSSDKNLDWIKDYAVVTLSEDHVLKKAMEKEMIALLGFDEATRIQDKALDIVIASQTKEHLPKITKSLSVKVKNAKSWVLYKYNNETGRDSYTIFSSKEEAIRAAIYEWGDLTPDEKKDYYNSSNGTGFCVALMDVVTFREGDSYIDTKDIKPVWALGKDVENYER